MTIGNGEYSDGRVCMLLDKSMLSVEAEVVVGVLLVLSVVVKLDLEGDLRIEGVRRDSWALGSSSLVYLPIEGR